jgi:trk system potassium uptake protein TrkH
MRLAIIQRIIGIFLIAFSVTLLPPMLLSVYYQDGALRAFLFSFGIMNGLGFLLWFPVRDSRKDLHIRDAFLITFLFWTVISFISALPFLFSPGLNLAQAIFLEVFTIFVLLTPSFWRR